MKVIEKIENENKKSEIFRDEKHKQLYSEICSRMNYLDCYHRSFAYLLSLDTVLREHIKDAYDFQEHCIKLEVLNKGFQTGTSLKTTRLAFNLWNGWSSDGKTYTDEDGYESELPSSYYTPEQIFNCAEYAPYYWQAIKIRFEID